MITFASSSIRFFLSGENEFKMSDVVIIVNFQPKMTFIPNFSYGDQFLMKLLRVLHPFLQDTSKLMVFGSM